MKYLRKMLSAALSLGLMAQGVIIPAAAASHRFQDIPSSAYYADGVDYCYANGLINGYSATRFAPEDPVSRGQIVTILHRHAGEPATAGSLSFQDVKPSDYFYNGVRWAVQNNVTTGYSTASFGPFDNLTREQLATLLFRYLGDDASKGSLSGFSDASKVSSFAREALSWAIGKGLISGTADRRIDPQGTATRGQLATILERLLNTDRKPGPDPDDGDQANPDWLSLYSPVFEDYYKSTGIKDLYHNRDQVPYVNYYGVGYVAPYMPLSYALEDLNSDGTPELILLLETQGEQFPIDIFTLDGTKPVNIMSGLPKGGDYDIIGGRLEVREDGTFYASAIGGAVGPGSRGYYNYYTFEPGNTRVSFLEGAEMAVGSSMNDISYIYYDANKNPSASDMETFTSFPQRHPAKRSFQNTTIINLN